MKRRNYGVSRVALALIPTLAAIFYCVHWAPAAYAQDASDAMQKCDALASHPHDPDRRAPGVTDDQMVPALATDACKLAVKLNPGEPRLLFELGRSETVYQHYDDAYGTLEQAANRGYAPAMKYLGDAYLKGLGLPSGQQRDARTALSWYEKSARGHFNDGAEIADKLRSKIDSATQIATFDPSIFQNPLFISKIYNHDETAVNKTDFMVYINGFIGTIGGSEPFFVNGQACIPKVSATTTSQLINVMAQIGLNSVGRSFNNPMGFAVEFGKFSDQGNRDAIALFNRYNCTGDIPRTVLQSINAYFDSSVRVAQPDATTEPQPETPRQVAPSFDCSKASKPDEFAICKSPLLSRYDRLTNQAFSEALHTPGNRDATLKYTRRLLTERHTCENDLDCITHLQLASLKMYRSLGSTVQDP